MHNTNTVSDTLSLSTRTRTRVVVVIPIKNLLTLNSTNQRLSDKASYSKLRHCALSELFKYAPDRKIPNYAWNNFHTKFTYDQIEQSTTVQAPVQAPVQPTVSGGVMTYCSIVNDLELVRALEVAASNLAMDEMYNNNHNHNHDVVLDIQCQFINQFHCAQADKIRKEATAAADHVVNILKILKEWIQKGTKFIKDQSSKVGTEDYVVVVVPDTHHRRADNQQLDEVEEKLLPMEWTSRSIQALSLLLPEQTSNSNSNNPSETWTAIHNHNGDTEKQVKNANPVVHFNEYEEAIDTIADSMIRGLDALSKFIHLAVDEHLENQSRKMKGHDDDDDDDELLSLSSTPSLAESASLSSNANSEEEEKEQLSVLSQEGVEVIIDSSQSNSKITTTTTNTNTNTNTCDDEWRSFFGEPMKEANDDEAIIVNNPCDADVISLSSSENKNDDVSSLDGSFAYVDDDDSSWAIFSDGE